MFSETALVLRMVLGWIFLSSAIGKLRQPVDFIKAVARYQVLPRRLSYLVGSSLIPVEASLAMSHLTGWLLRIAAITGLATLCSFAVVIAWNLERDLPCLCFGVQSKDRVSGRTLARLLLLATAELLVCVEYVWNQTPSVLSNRPLNIQTLTRVVVWPAVVLITGTWSLRSYDIVTLLRATGGASAGQRPK